MSGRFDDRATQPMPGPRDMLAWKVLRRSDAWSEGGDALDTVRPGIDDRGAAALASGKPYAVWIGHATWALRLSGKLVVTDPIWSTSLSGVVRRLVPPGVALAAMPHVDVVLVTHDHRDHMDLPTLAQLPDDALYVVPLGNAARLAKLGKQRVVELDWWQTHDEDGLAITLVPARHWSMRAPWNRNDTLWGGYVVRAAEGVAYHSGDTAFGDHFSEIAARVAATHGAIDWAMLPIGAYSPRWFMASQHIDPDEAARAWQLLGAEHLLAMHWGTFRVTDEPIGEPPARLRAWWREHGLPDERLWIVDVGEPRSLA